LSVSECKFSIVLYCIVRPKDAMLAVGIGQSTPKSSRSKAIVRTDIHKASSILHKTRNFKYSSHKRTSSINLSRCQGFVDVSSCGDQQLCRTHEIADLSSWTSSARSGNADVQRQRCQIRLTIIKLSRLLYLQPHRAAATDQPIFTQPQIYILLR